MNRLYVAVLLSLLIFAGGCKKKAPETISDPIGGASITLPSGFRSGPIRGSTQESQALFRLQASNLFKDIGVGVTSEIKVDLATTFTLDEYITTVNNKRKIQLKNFVIESTKNKTCSGMPCVEQVFTCSMDSMNIKYLATIVETPKAFHQVVTWTSPSRFAANGADMRSIHDSFREKGSN
jgi:hypothetical protein